MYYLFLEIGSYKQLMRLQPDQMTELLSQLGDAASRRGAVAAAKEAGQLLFRFPTLEETRRGPVLEAAAEVQELLASRAQELAGYSVVIDRAEDERDAEVAERLRDFVLSVPTDESLWLTPGATQALRSLVERVDDRGYLRVVGRRAGGQEPLGAAADFVVMARAVAEIGELLGPWINGEREPGVLLVYGDELDGVEENVAAAVSPLEDIPGGTSWPRVVGYAGEHAPYRALLRTITEEDLERAAAFLSSVERACYEERKEVLLSLLRRPFSITYHRLRPGDVQAAYTLFLTGRLRAIRAQLGEPGIVVESADTVSRDTVSVLAGALEALEPALQPMVVLTAREDTVPAPLLSREVVRYRLPTFSAEELAERATSSLKEGARRKLRIAAGMARTGGKPLAVYHHFSNLQEDRDFEPTGTSDTENGVFADSLRALGRLSEEAISLLYCCGELHGFLNKRGVSRFLEDGGMQRVRVAEYLGDLSKRAFLRDEWTCLPRARALARAAGSFFPDGGLGMRKRLAAWCSKLLEAGELVPDRTVARLLSQGDMSGQAVEIMGRLLSWQCDAGNVDYAEELEGQEMLEVAGDHPEHRLRAEVYRYVSASRRHLGRGELEDARRLLARSPDTGEEPKLRGSVALQQGRLRLAEGKLDEATRLLKRALLAFQEAREPELIARAHLEFGLVLLGREQVSEAREYFFLVQGETSVSAHTLATAQLLEALTLYLEGGYSRLLETIEQFRARRQKSGLEDRLLVAGFLEARTLFELGRYQEAAARFASGMATARILDDPMAFRVHHLWAARCEVYLDNTAHAERVLESYESDAEVSFFRAEARYRTGDPRGALIRLEEALEQATAEHSDPRALLQWSGGFAAVEDLAVGRIRGDRVIANLIRALRGYILSEVGERQASMEDLYRLTRGRRPSAVDPYRGHYLYCYSVSLADAGPERFDDPTTVLARAVKHLRERTGRIDRYADKTDYVRRNLWNARLMEAADRHNLL
ncbi:MAG: hypothetical protein ACLFM5_02060 [Spirochaetaceae bacterium]